MRYFSLALTLGLALPAGAETTSALSARAYVQRGLALRATAAPTGTTHLPFVEISSRGCLGFDARTNQGYCYSQPDCSTWGSHKLIYKWWGKFNFADRAYATHAVTAFIPVSATADGTVTFVHYVPRGTTVILR